MSIVGSREYKQLINNQVQNIQDKDYIQWRHLGSRDNPSDLGSPGGKVEDCTNVWWKGPLWLHDPEGGACSSRGNQEGPRLIIAEVGPVEDYSSLFLGEAIHKKLQG